jgi:DNA polymerase III subunit gamma/tau
MRASQLNRNEKSIFGAMSTKKESFVVSARKYRPASWGEVIGQEAITDTLHNSIEQDHLAHAYLFCGPRGVGKTTCARIFAKEINRSEEHLDEDFSFNIFELDAASNNKVDDIRNLTDQVRIPPQIGQYKVYIIDEVHMLSTQAFNAFLKTLEEPPKHAIFILATTEKHKIIPTILSRCQIYDFNRIPVEEIVKHLRAITVKEKIEAEEEALHVVAQKADGALRDALSIFDQLVSFTNGNLTYDAVLKNLHVLDYDYYFKLSTYLNDGDYSSALMLLDEILKLGFDPGHFISGLGSHFRDLLVCQEPKTVELLEVGNAVKQQYLDQAGAIDAAWLLLALKEAQQAEFRIKTTVNPRLLLEIALLSIAGIGTGEKKNSESDLTGTRRIVEPSKPRAQNAVPSTPVAKEPPAAQVHSAPASTPSETPEPSEPISEEPEIVVASEPEPEPIKKTEEEIHEALNPPTLNPTPGKRTRRAPSTISLSLDKEAEPAVAQSIGEVMEATEVETKLNLNDAWTKVLAGYQDEKKSAIHTILSRVDIDSFEGKEQIVIGLQHNVEEEEYALHSSDTLQQLRAFTGNKALQISTELLEVVMETKLFTAKEKFEHLAKKNKNLLKLKQDLDLDIAY